MSRAVEQVFYRVWCHSTHWTNIWYASIFLSSSSASLSSYSISVLQLCALFIAGSAYLTLTFDIHSVQKKTFTHFFFYISMENVSIYTKFSGYVCEESLIPLKSKLNIHSTADSQTFYQNNVYLLLWNPLFTNMWTWRQNYVTGSNEYLIFMSVEYVIHRKHTLKIVCKSEHFPSEI